jgi:hypothetical protein
VARITAIIALAIMLSNANAGEWSGYVGGELRLFPSGSDLDDAYHASFSLAAEPEYYHSWDDGYQSLTFKPFLRVDSHDSHRTHFDLRELYWEKAAENWELRAGVRRVFWGKTESQHLVDIINQTDLVENIDTEDKLGQPMINLALVRDWGTLDLFLLPGFRERTFPDEDARLRGPLPIKADDARYESGAKQWHVDFAARWSHFIGNWDLGVSHFHGTSREPRLVPDLSRGLRHIELVPYYDQIDQTGVDLQYTKGSWLWKFEGIHRSGMGDTYNAITAGFEYTLYGVFNSDADMGLLMEYLYDDRGDGATTPYQRDIFLGTRVSLNDVQTTQILAGAIVDQHTGATLLRLEASRRLGKAWRLTIEANAFLNVPSSDRLLHGIRQDDYLQIGANWYF